MHVQESVASGNGSGMAWKRVGGGRCRFAVAALRRAGWGHSARRGPCRPWPSIRSGQAATRRTGNPNPDKSVCFKAAKNISFIPRFFRSSFRPFCLDAARAPQFAIGVLFVGRGKVASPRLASARQPSAPSSAPLDVSTPIDRWTRLTKAPGLGAASRR